MTRSTFDEAGPLDELDDPDGPGPRNGLAAYLRPPDEAGRFLPLHGIRAVAAVAVVIYYVAGYAGLWFGPSPVAGFLRNLGNFEGTGTNSASVDIQSVTADSVAGSVSYSYTDDQGASYGLSGTFEVIRCPN